tara:strand:- start:393 stop:611 length:219 start_codon:yes stop_codon:yes gene_type:complete
VVRNIKVVRVPTAAVIKEASVRRDSTGLKIVVVLHVTTGAPPAQTVVGSPRFMVVVKMIKLGAGMLTSGGIG